MTRKVIVSKNKFFILKLWEFACLFTAMAYVNLVFLHKNLIRMRHFNYTQGNFMRLFFYEFLERLTESIFIGELKTSLALLLRINCLREYRY